MNYEPNTATRLLSCPSQEIISEVCRKCPLFETKPGNEPAELKAPLNDALELEELFELGFKPTFQEVMTGALTIKQIAALKGLKLGRNKAEKSRGKEIKHRVRQQQANSQANNLVKKNRGGFE